MSELGPKKMQKLLALDLDETLIPEHLHNALKGYGVPDGKALEVFHANREQVKASIETSKSSKLRGEYQEEAEKAAKIENPDMEEGFFDLVALKLDEIMDQKRSSITVTDAEIDEYINANFPLEGKIPYEVLSAKPEFSPKNPKELASLILEAMQNKDFVAVVTFSSYAEVIKPLMSRILQEGATSLDKKKMTKL